MSEPAQSIVQRAKELLNSFQQEGSFESEGLSDPDVKDLKTALENIRIYQEELKLQQKELIKSNKKLMLSRDKFINLFNFSPIALCIVNLNGKILQVNKSFLQLLGLQHFNDIKATPIYQFFYENERITLLKFLNTMSENQFKFTQNKFILQYQKVSIPVMITGSKIQSHDKVPVCYLAIENLATSEYVKEITNHNEYLVNTISSLGEAFISVNRKHMITNYNKKTMQLLNLGDDSEDITDMKIDSVFELSHTDGKFLSFTEIFETVRDQGELVLPHMKLIYHKNSFQAKIIVSAIIIDELIQGYVLVFDDITLALKEQNELIKSQQLSSIGKLAGGLAHDINNLLTVIQANFDYIKTTMKIGESQQLEDRFFDIEYAVQDAAAVTSRFLVFSSGQTITFDPVDLKPLIQRAISLNFSNSAIEVNCHIPSDLMNIHGRDIQIRQIINNLIVNAMEATGKNGTITITAKNILSASQIPDELGIQIPCIKISVEDDGGGISPDDMEHILDPYFTTKKQGNGLGLTIISSILHDHHGHLRFSNTDQGAIFEVYLPISDLPIYMDKDKSVRAISPKTIAIMDDRDDLLEILKKLLQELGHQVSVARNGEEIMELMNIAQFDLFILDLVIDEGMGGIMTLEKILEKEPNAKVVICTGYSNLKTEMDPQTFGYIEALDKPYTMDRIEQLFQKLFDN